MLCGKPQSTVRRSDVRFLRLGPSQSIGLPTSLIVMSRMTVWVVASWVVLALCIGTPVLALKNGLALTPPMGWLSWERFLCNVDCKKDPENCISERLYKTMADLLVKEGFKDAGYEYVNIDDCWMSDIRDVDGSLQANVTRFPSGIEQLAEYMHGKGLKLGIYQDCGFKTCGGYPGSLGHYKKDAETFAAWGVDMLKLDGCYAIPSFMDMLYPEMTEALNSTGRPILFSCSWPAYQVEKGQKPDYKTIAKYCNMWRNYNDIADSWASVTSIIDYYASVQDDLVAASGPGRWSDPDMLMIGNYGLSLDQSKAQMALWAILAAPLFMSTDLRTISPEHKAILTNPDVIAINQDPLGRMGYRAYKEKGVEIWMRSVSPLGKHGSSSAAIVFFNRRDMGGPVNVSVQVSSLGLNYFDGYTFTNLFDNATKFFLMPEDNLEASVNPSGVVMYKASTV